jgi:hypothetical protein
VTTIDRTEDGALAETAGRALAGDQARAERVASERRFRRTMLNLAIRLASLAIALLLWEWVGSNIDPVLFTTPSAVAVAAVEMIRNGDLWNYLWPSLVVLAVGLTLAAITGIATGSCSRATGCSTSRSRLHHLPLFDPVGGAGAADRDRGGVRVRVR